MPGDRVKPRQHRFAGAVGVPHLVDAQPGFLQQVVRVAANSELNNEESVQLRAQTENQVRGRGEITLLVTGHQRFQIAGGSAAITGLARPF
jgi:hypothetical protein